MELLKEEDHGVLVHCAAGIHRTGVVAYSLLRLCGGYENKEAAYAALGTLRKETYRGVEGWRIELAEANIVSHL